VTNPNHAQPTGPAPENLPEDTAARGGGQPVFYQRLKPEYTEQADLAGVVATVELEAVFRDDGTVGEIEVVKWAGFGLDESAIATVKKLRFKPAERGEKTLTIKGLVRYNFRRPLSQVERQEEIERLKRSLHEINKQTSGQRPKP
jgi:TonB family protein